MRSLIAALSAAAAIAGLAMTAPATAAQPADGFGSTGSFTPVTPFRAVSQSVAARGKVSYTNPAYAGVGGVALTITALSPKANGGVVAYGGKGTAPGVVNLQLTTGQRSSDYAVVQPDANGTISFYNASSGTVSLLVDISGVYAANVSDTVKSYHPVTPKRVVNTTTGAGGNRKGALNPHGSAYPVIGPSNSGVPGGGAAGAVAVTFTTLNAKAAGLLTAGPYNLPIKAASVAHWSTGQRTSSFAIVPVDADGRMTLVNGSDGTLDVEVDVVGWFAAGAPQYAGQLDNVPAATIYDSRDSSKLGAGATRTIPLSGRGGLPVTGSAARAVVVSLVAITPASTGGLNTWPAGQSKPSTTNLQFQAGHTSNNVAIVPLSPGGQLSVYNGSSASLDFAITVTGWVPNTTVAVPPTQTGRYVQNLTGNVSRDTAIMAAEGKQDAGSDYVLLELGAQKNDKTGVALTIVGTAITYGELNTVLQAYVNAYAANGGTGTIALGTSNDAQDWTTYPAAQRGADWANKVVEKIDAPTGVTIAGADDIESGFGTHKLSDAQGWKRAYLAATNRGFVYNGSADNCPVDFNRLGQVCDYGWREQDYVNLASGSGVTVLPQIYTSRQAIQWTNIDATKRASGGGGLNYAGALTEHPFDGSYTPANGYSALYRGLQANVGSPSIPAVVELHADT